MDYIFSKPIESHSFVFESKFGPFYFELKLYSDYFSVKYIELNNEWCFSGTFDIDDSITAEHVYNMFIDASNGVPGLELQFGGPNRTGEAFSDKVISGIVVHCTTRYHKSSHMINFEMKDDEALKARYALYFANKRIGDLENQLEESKDKIREVTDRCARLEDKFETMGRQIEKLSEKVDSNSNSNHNNLPRNGSPVHPSPNPIPLFNYTGALGEDFVLSTNPWVPVYMLPCGRLHIPRAPENDFKTNSNNNCNCRHEHRRECNCESNHEHRCRRECNCESNREHRCRCRCECNHEHRCRCECNREHRCRCECNHEYRCRCECRCHCHCHCHCFSHCHLMPEYAGLRGVPIRLHSGLPCAFEYAGLRGVHIRLDSRLPCAFEYGTWPIYY